MAKRTGHLHTVSQLLQSQSDTCIINNNVSNQIRSQTIPTSTYMSKRTGHLHTVSQLLQSQSDTCIINNNVSNQIRSQTIPTSTCSAESIVIDLEDISSPRPSTLSSESAPEDLTGPNNNIYNPPGGLSGPNGAFQVPPAHFHAPNGAYHVHSHNIHPPNGYHVHPLNIQPPNGGFHVHPEQFHGPNGGFNIHPEHLQAHNGAFQVPPEQPNFEHHHILGLFSVFMSPEVALIYNVLMRYGPFVLIILAKAVYDFGPGVLLFAGLLATFTFANYHLKKEITSSHRTNVGCLFHLMFLLLSTICFYFYLYNDLKLYKMLFVFLLPDVKPVTTADLLWLVGTNDLVLKLMTIVVKMIVSLIPTHRRARLYVAIEATSQLYRSIVPTKSWIYFLFDPYHIPQNMVCACMCGIYVGLKSDYLIKKAQFFGTSMFNLLQSVQIGVAPTEEELSNAYPICAICHDDYVVPVRLSCHHIFCEECITRWLITQKSCPMCRAEVIDDPSWRDGATSHVIQFF